MFYEIVGQIILTIPYDTTISAESKAEAMDFVKRRMQTTAEVKARDAGGSVNECKIESIITLP